MTRERWSAIGAPCVAVVMMLGACSSSSTDDDAGAVTASTVDEDEQTINSLTEELDEQTARADEAQAQLDDIAAMFPVTVTASLENYDLVGAYTLSMTEAYCDGFPTCGVPRPDVRADIIKGTNGLELKVPNVLTAGLFDVNGSLFAVVDSNQILEPCGATTRTARVSITIFADGVSIAEDGTQSLTGLGASLLISADELDTCSAGVVFFAATLTPV